MAYWYGGLRQVNVFICLIRLYVIIDKDKTSPGEMGICG